MALTEEQLQTLDPDLQSLYKEMTAPQARPTEKDIYDQLDADLQQDYLALYEAKNGKKPDWLKEPGFFAKMGQALEGGIDQTGNALSTLGSSLLSDYDTLAVKQRDPNLSKDREELQRAIANIDENDPWYEQVASAGYEVLSRPSAVAQETAAQAPNLALAGGSAWAGAKAGAAIGTAIAPGVGTAIGGIIGTAAGYLLSNTAIESGFILNEKGQDGMVTLEERREGLRQGATKGAVISAIDLASLGTSKLIVGGAGRAVEKAVKDRLIDAGVDVTDDVAIRTALQANEELLTDAVGVAGESLKKSVGRLGLAAVVESVAEGSGEYFGSQAAGLDASIGEAVLEAVTSLPLSAAEIATVRNIAKRNPGKLTQLRDEVLTEIQSRDPAEPETLLIGYEPEVVYTSPDGTAYTDRQFREMGFDEVQGAIMGRADVVDAIAESEKIMAAQQRVDEIDAAFTQREQQLREEREQQVDQLFAQIEAEIEAERNQIAKESGEGVESARAEERTYVSAEDQDALNEVNQRAGEPQTAMGLAMQRAQEQQREAAESTPEATEPTAMAEPAVVAEEPEPAVVPGPVADEAPEPIAAKEPSVAAEETAGEALVEDAPTELAAEEEARPSTAAPEGEPFKRQPRVDIGEPYVYEGTVNGEVRRVAKFEGIDTASTGWYEVDETGNIVSDGEGARSMDRFLGYTRKEAEAKLRGEVAAPEQPVIESGPDVAVSEEVVQSAQPETAPEPLAEDLVELGEEAQSFESLEAREEYISTLVSEEAVTPEEANQLREFAGLEPVEVATEEVVEEAPAEPAEEAQASDFERFTWNNDDGSVGRGFGRVISEKNGNLFIQMTDEAGNDIEGEEVLLFEEDLRSRGDPGKAKSLSMSIDQTPIESPVSASRVKEIARQRLGQYENSGLEVVVTRSTNLSGRVKRALEESGDDISAVKGFRVGDTVVIVYDNLASEKDARVAIAHEAIGHFGFEKIVNIKEFMTQFRQLKNSGSRQVQSILEEVQRRYGDVGETTQMKEFVAVAQERREKSNAIQRFVRQVKQAMVRGLRRLGVVDSNFSMSDLDAALDQAEIVVSQDQTAATEEAEISFSKQKGGTKHGISRRYIVRSPGKVRGKSALVKKIDPKNAERQAVALGELAGRNPDPLESKTAWNRFERDLLGDNEHPAAPFNIIALAENMDEWVADHSRMTEGQLEGAKQGFKMVEEIKAHYASGNAKPQDSAKLFLWGMLSRMLSAHPHESAFIDAMLVDEDATGASMMTYINRAIERPWDRQDTADYLDWVSSAIPDYSPAKSATSNLNDFGAIFLKKMSERGESGRSKLEELHDMIADTNMSSAEVRRAYYGLGEGMGIQNKVLSFIMLMTGRDDVVVLDRIQINSMWDAARYGKNIYEDIQSLFEGAHGLARYEALERSLLRRLPELYARLGRPEDASVGRYHWESWVLNSGQVVSHPSVEGFIRDVNDQDSAYYDIGAPEGRYHQYAFGSIYARDNEGPYILYPDSEGSLHRMGTERFKEFLAQVRKPKNGVVPPGFSVKVFYDVGMPWYEAPAVNRNKLDELINEYSEQELVPSGQNDSQQDSSADRQRRQEARLKLLGGPIRAGLKSKGNAPVSHSRGRPRGSGERYLRTFTPTAEAAKRYKAAGVSPAPIDEIKDPARFRQAIEKLAESNPNFASVYVYDDYTDMRLFLTKDNKSGFAIKPDGDIVSVFNGSDKRPGFANNMMALAVQEGGRKLDAFDTALPHIYALNGFKAVARVKWDDSQAPEMWDKDLYSAFNNGEPDVVMMVYDPQSNSLYDGEGPYMDYDAALEAQSEETIQFSKSTQRTTRDRLRPKENQTQSSKYADANRRLREEDQTMWESAKKLWKKGFMPGGLLPDNAFDLQIKRDSQMRGDAFEVESITRAYERATKTEYGAKGRKLDENVIEAHAQFLAGKPISGIIPGKTKEALTAMRQYLDGLSKEYVKILELEKADLEDAARRRGEDPAENAEVQQKQELLTTIQSNVGEYVNRSYRAFDDTNWFRNIPVKVFDEAMDYFVSAAMEQGSSLSEAQRRAEGIIDDIVKKGTAYESMEAMIRESTLGAKDLSILKKRQEIAPEVLALLGEYRDPRMNFTRSAHKMSRLIWNHRFLENVKTAGEGVFLFEEQDATRGINVQISAAQNPAMAPIDGMWTTREVKQAFQDALGPDQMGEIVGMVVRANGMVKMGKTVLSPTTAARNLQSAAFFAVFNGHFNPKPAGKSWRAMKEFVGGGGDKEIQDYITKMRRLGVVYDSANGRELRELMKDAFKNETVLSEWRLAGGAKEVVSRGLEVAQNFYMAGDDFWKIIGFENEKANLMDAGVPEAQAETMAAERIRNTYPTYSMVGRYIQQLRRFPLAGTFVSFPAEIIRTSFNHMKYMAEDFKAGRTKMGMKRATGFAIAAGFAHAVQALSKILNDVDDDEEEAIRLMGPPWSENSNFWFFGKNEDGAHEQIDLSFVDPYNIWKRPITAIVRDQPWEESFKEAAVEFLKPFFGVDIAAGAIFEVMANEKASGGKIYSESDDPDRIAFKSLDHIRKTLQPGFVSNIERTMKAAQGERRPTGQKYDLTDELVAWGGWRVSTLNPTMSLKFKSFEFRDALRDASSSFNSVLRDRNDVSDEELAEAYAYTLRKRDEAYTKFGRLIDSARESGMSDAEIFGVVNGSGVSKIDTASLLRGETPPWRPSAQTSQSMLREARNVFKDEEYYRELRERIQEANRLAAQR